MAPLRTGDGFPNVVVTAVASTTSLAPDAENDVAVACWKAEAAFANWTSRSSQSSNRRSASAARCRRVSTNT